MAAAWYRNASGVNWPLIESSITNHSAERPTNKSVFFPHKKKKKAPTVSGEMSAGDMLLVKIQRDENIFLLKSRINRRFRDLEM